MRTSISAILGLATALSLSTFGSAHGVEHSDADNDHTGLSWAEIHMLEEHHIANFDPTAFFNLHDFDSSHTWTSSEILRTYGLAPDAVGAYNVPQSKRDEVVKSILDLMDYDNDGAVTLDEFVEFHKGGGKLPDFGLGVGHHGDDEYEYEIHHFEKFHNEDSTEDELTHPEDIEHFRLHEQLEKEEEKLKDIEDKGIVLENIPKKFRRAG